METSEQKLKVNCQAHGPQIPVELNIEDSFFKRVCVRCYFEKLTEGLEHLEMEKERE